MADFVVKLVKEYNCRVDDEPRKVTKTRIISANSIDVDAFEDHWIVTIDDARIIFEVPMNIIGDEWMDEEGVTTAAYIENARGKTTHFVKSFIMLGEPLDETEQSDA